MYWLESHSFRKLMSANIARVSQYEWSKKVRKGRHLALRYANCTLYSNRLIFKNSEIKYLPWLERQHSIIFIYLLVNINSFKRRTSKELKSCTSINLSIQDKPLYIIFTLLGNWRCQQYLWDWPPKLRYLIK